MGSEYNVKVFWETGEITHEPLDLMAKQIPVDLALYARDNNLLSKPGWKRFRPIACRKKQIMRLVKQAKL